MALFGRKQPDIDSVPQEVQDYYQSERRERTGVAWLLALATLVVTLLLAVGLFYGGRWVYRTAFKQDKAPQTAQPTATTPATTNISLDGPDEDQASSRPASTPQSTPSTSPSPSPSPASSSTPSPTPTSTPTPSPSVASSTNRSALVNTGPGDAAMVFIVATVAGIVAYRIVWVRGSARS